MVPREVKNPDVQGRGNCCGALPKDVHDSYMRGGAYSNRGDSAGKRDGHHVLARGRGANLFFSYVIYP